MQTMQITKTTRVAVIGAGPIGLEAALCAGEAGLDTVVMESGGIGANVAAWGFLGMFTSWAMNTTPLGRQALGDDPLLTSEQAPTGAEFAEKYLLPLSQSDALAGRIDTGVRVLAVGRDEIMHRGGSGSAGEDSAPFRLLVCDRFGVEQFDHADVVLDCSGTYGQSRWTGHGGMPARGELGMKQSIWYTVPDVLGRDRSRFAGRHTLLIGTGTLAASILMNLSQLATSSPRTLVTWAFHRWGEILRHLDEDPLPGRRALAEKALRLTASPPPWLTLLENAEVESLSAERGKSVILRQQDQRISCHADEIIAAVGYRPDDTLFAPLGGQPAYVSASETRNSIESAGDDRPVVATVAGPACGHLVTAAPGYYLLGAKSYGANSNFLLRVGHRQVRDALADILGGHRHGESPAAAG